MIWGPDGDENGSLEISPGFIIILADWYIVSSSTPQLTHKKGSEYKIEKWLDYLTRLYVS